MDFVSRFTMTGLDFLASLFVVFVGFAFVCVLVMYVIDHVQKSDAIRHNYPVVGRFRYIFITLGEFFRQYFFAMDREEKPFNRAQREWVNRSSSGLDNTVAFGSTENLNLPGAIIFGNSAFPTLSHEAKKPSPLLIGPYARVPYEATSLIHISAMSFGAISKPAVQALSKGAKLAQCWLNTGEGGLSSYHLEGGCDLVFQIGTAKYGVRNESGELDEEKLKEISSYEQVKMVEIKLSQGAKPGKGGLLPGMKVTEEISRIRGIPVGQDSISPNRHLEVDSVDTLLDLVNKIRDISGKPTGFKAVMGDFEWIELMCQKIHERGIESAPDFIAVDSGDGGTGAAPMPLMDNVGLLIRESLPQFVDVLARHGLRERIRVIASGKLVTPAEVAWALCAGADFVASARGFMFSIGCIQAMRCNKNTCPSGVATHDKRLQSGLDPEDKSVRVKNFVDKIHYGVGLIAHACGLTCPRMLKRKHVSVVDGNGRLKLLSDIFPGR